MSTPATPSTTPTPGSEPSLGGHLRPELHRALGDATRLEVLKRLVAAPTPQTVTEVASCCGVHLSGVSRHLALLRDVGVVRAEREGREVRYSLDREAITTALRGLADAIDRCCDASSETGVCCPEETKKNES